jgi:quinol monooxygenase YgiN
VQDLLTQAVTLANEETRTTVWFALKLGASTFGVFDAFADEEGRQAHLEGPIAHALMANAPHLLTRPPQIDPVDVIGAKLAQLDVRKAA